MIFTSFIPRAQLAPYVESIWMQEDLCAVNFGTINPIKVLPTTAVTMGFQYGDKQEVVRNGVGSTLSHHGVSGIQTAPVLYRNSGTIGSIIVRFKPWGAANFFRTPLMELKDRNTDGESLLNRQAVADVIDRLRNCPDAEARIATVENYLCSLLLDRPIDRVVAAITVEMQQAQGLCRIDTMADRAGISKRQLERRFNEIIGVSPKKFASIIRFQSVLQLSPRNKNLTALAYDAGYFDQAHFIKDFQAFAGESPEVFFAGFLQPELAGKFNGGERVYR